VREREVSSRQLLELSTICDLMIISKFLIIDSKDLQHNNPNKIYRSRSDRCKRSSSLRLLSTELILSILYATCRFHFVDHIGWQSRVTCALLEQLYLFKSSLASSILIIAKLYQFRQPGRQGSLPETENAVSFSWISSQGAPNAAFSLLLSLHRRITANFHI
jgi:hypothetical protein